MEHRFAQDISFKSILKDNHQKYAMEQIKANQENRQRIIAKVTNQLISDSKTSHCSVIKVKTEDAAIVTAWLSENFIKYKEEAKSRGGYDTSDETKITVTFSDL